MGLNLVGRALGEPTVLVLSPDDRVSAALATLFAPHGIHIAVPRLEESVPEAVTRTAADVVLVSSACGDDVVGAIMTKDVATFVPVLLFTPHADAPALETTSREAVQGLAKRYDLPFLELSRDVESVAMQLRLLAGQQPLS